MSKYIEENSFHSTPERAMNDDKRVSHMDTSRQGSDAAVIQIPVWLEQRLNSKCPCKSTPKRKLKRRVCDHSLTYYWVHAAYFAVLAVAGTMSLWWCRGNETISLVDCTFNAVSALTATGLSSVLLRDFTPLGLVTLMALMFFGNTVFVSLLPVYIRRFQFFRHDNAAAVKLGLNEHNTADVNCLTLGIKKKSSTNREAIDISKTGDDGLGVWPEIKSETVANCCGKSPQESQHETALLERQALITLSWLVPIYMLLIMSFGFICIICYTSVSSSRVRALYEGEEVNPIHTAIFLSVSAFSNTGMSPFDENMMPFAAAPLVLVPLAVLILAGNTMFPPSLRFIIWGISSLKRADDPQKKVYEYLLQFPRRCYTHLFPRVHTLWLVATVVAFNTVDLVAFCALEWNSAAGSSNAGVKLMDGLFQSLNTRSAGMNVLPLRSLSPPMLVLYTSMMYIAAYPVFLSRQHSRLARGTDDVNLGHQLYNSTKNKTFEQNHSEKFEDNKLSRQYSKLFTRDSAVVFVHVFLICIVELRSMNSDPLNYTLFSIVFEVISAYGNVGLSLGYSCERWVRVSMNTVYVDDAASCNDVPFSFSGKWKVGSKLILVSCMLLGRHRSLPDNMDSAVTIDMPSELCDSCQCSHNYKGTDTFHSPSSNLSI